MRTMNDERLVGQLEVQQIYPKYQGLDDLSLANELIEEFFSGINCLM